MVRHRSATPLFPGSNPGDASTSEQSPLCSVFLCSKTSALSLAPPFSQKVSVPVGCSLANTLCAFGSLTTFCWSVAVYVNIRKKCGLHKTHDFAQPVNCLYSINIVWDAYFITLTFITSSIALNLSTKSFVIISSVLIIVYAASFLLLLIISAILIPSSEKIFEN